MISVSVAGLASKPRGVVINPTGTQAPGLGQLDGNTVGDLSSCCRKAGNSRGEALIATFGAQRITHPWSAGGTGDEPKSCFFILECVGRCDDDSGGVVERMKMDVVAKIARTSALIGTKWNHKNSVTRS